MATKLYSCWRDTGDQLAVINQWPLRALDDGEVQPKENERVWVVLTLSRVLLGLTTARRAETLCPPMPDAAFVSVAAWLRMECSMRFSESAGDNGIDMQSSAE
eukprot:CAMPEP_0182523818 /NCGR_PEP_ID=MMETSP1323-20130603/1336_1 /TAXON_ID=236787 /ORGANISM="Florenciella parvula, Strain RCC1693" /LENGTH=102 /DNA_ID=CAMNT_0024732263 /DNA_START=287 /DNA_END=595 /DNA_ORIENTATION=+